MLRVGTETGSLVNHLMGGTTSIAPTVGMGITILCWTDRRAATIVAVSKSGKQFEFTYDVATRTDTNGMSECQKYDYTPVPEGPRHTAKLLKKGWRVGSRGVRLGARNTYYDYSF